MSVISQRFVQLVYRGDAVGTYQFPALANYSALQEPLQVVNLVAGNNTITLPTAGVNTPVIAAVTIIPPPGNSTVILLKGVAGDSATLSLHPTDPMVLTFATTVTSFVLNAASPINGVLLYWS